jgi:diaminopimelate decarboxylase
MAQSAKPHSFSRDQQGQTWIGGCRIDQLIQRFGSPLYILDYETIVSNCNAYTQPLSQHYPNHKIIYAGKANLTVGLLNILAAESVGVDVVSGGELYTALQSNMTHQSILFHGNNKSHDELKMAVENQVTIVIDNRDELTAVSEIASAMCPAKIMVRLKPEIEAHTHRYIKTGQSDSKFGVTAHEMMEIIRECAQMPHVTFLGIHSHIGSQIFDSDPFVALVSCMVGHMVAIKREFGIEIEQLNLGGGIGISYTDDDNPLEVSAIITTLVKDLKRQLDQYQLSHPRLLLEPGRSIVGNAGITVYTIGTIKEIPKIKTYLFVDGGMADNPRPMMYDALYTMELGRCHPQAQPSDYQEYAIAGKFCESGDILAHKVLLPSPKKGDLLIVHGTGAYNYSMASNYNRACRPAMIIVKDGQSNLLVNRETYQDLVRLDVPMEPASWV